MTSRRSFLQGVLLVGGTLALGPALGRTSWGEASGRPLLLLTSDEPACIAVGRGVASALARAAGHGTEARLLGEVDFGRLCADFAVHEGDVVIVVEEGHAWQVDEALRVSHARVLAQGSHFAARDDGSGAVRHHFQALPASVGIDAELAAGLGPWSERLGAALARTALRLPPLAPRVPSADAGDGQQLSASGAALRLTSYVIELKGAA